MAYLNSNSEKIDQPSCITKNLFEHQKKAIYAMTKLERTNKLKIDVSRLSAVSYTHLTLPTKA